MFKMILIFDIFWRLAAPRDDIQVNNNEHKLKDTRLPSVVAPFLKTPRSRS